jgi:hypothetical protein
MKSNSKKMVAEITTAITTAITAKSNSKKILKTIDNTAKKIAKKINKRILKTTAGTKGKKIKKAPKTKKSDNGMLPEVKKNKLLTEMAADEIKAN